MQVEQRAQSHFASDFDSDSGSYCGYVVLVSASRLSWRLDAFLPYCLYEDLPCGIYSAIDRDWLVGSR